MVSDNITGPAPNLSTVPYQSTGAYTETSPFAERALEKLQSQFPAQSFPTKRFRDELTVVVPRENIVEVCQFLRDDAELQFNFLSDLTGNDWPGREMRFEVNYHLYSLETYARLRLKVLLDENDAVCPSVTEVWGTANWHERETFDMFGIVFSGHPDLRRILLPLEWDGHPLRQDYPKHWEEPEFTVRKVKRDYAQN